MSVLLQLFYYGLLGSDCYLQNVEEGLVFFCGYGCCCFVAQLHTSFSCPFLKELLNIVSNGVGGGDRRVTLDNRALLVDQELLKVPLDALEAQETGLLGLEESVHGVLLVAVHINLAHDGELDSKVDLAERGDF